MRKESLKKNSSSNVDEGNNDNDVDMVLNGGVAVDADPLVYFLV